jgi:Na+-driven multidrug efflux pump
LRWPICLAIMAIGSPPCLMQIAASVLNSILNHQLGDYGGALAISVWGIMWSIMMVFFMPVVGICQGSQPIIGYNFGAERFDRVKQALQTGVLAASAVSLVGFLLAMLSPGLLIRLFDSTDQSQISLGSHAMRIAFFMSPLIGFQIVSASYFQAVGKPVHSMFLSLSRQILILIPMLLILPRFFGLDGVWAAIPTADFSSSLLTGIWLFLELRHLHRRHTDGNGEMLLAAAAENSTV